MEYEESYIRIIDDKGVHKGALQVRLMPEIGTIDLDDYDNLNELKGKELGLEVRIKEAADIPEEYANNVYCSYETAILGDEPYST